MKLAFKKLFIFQAIVKALGVQHFIGGKMQVFQDRVRKITDFPVPVDKTRVRAFLRTIGITHRWVPNFSEISRPLSRLTGKVEWQWTASEQLAFDILKIK